MKKLILFALFISGNSLSSFACDRVVDLNKVVLFLDANNSPTEIKAASKAACERGESFKKLPDEGELLGEAQLEKNLKDLAAKNIAVTSLIASGHDGGGNIHGNSGEITKYEIIRAVKTAYSNKPELASQFQSVYMWGCWSMGPAEIAVWRSELPSLKMLSGFMDMGPLNTTEATYTVLHGLLVKEKSLIAMSDQAKLKRTIAMVENINITSASVYSEAACGDMLYYNTQGVDYGVENRNADDSNFTPGNHFVDYNKNFDCKSANEGIERNRKLLIKYFYGELPLPPNDANSPITKIYSFLRSHAHCLKEDHVLNPDRVGMLRFYEEIKANFAKVFSSQIEAVTAQFKFLDGFTQSYKAKGLPMQQFEKYFQAGKGNFFKPDAATLKTKSRKDIMNMIAYLDGMVKQPMARDPKFAVNIKGLKKLRNAMDNYLFQLNPKCMDFLDWHEHAAGHYPGAACEN